MDFHSSIPIYLQIAEIFYEHILIRKWQAGERIPSVREIAVMVEVNPNTAMRAFSFLQEQGVIYNKRGIGYFVANDGYTRVLDIKRKEFVDEILPDVFKKMKMLNVSFEQVEQSYKQAIKKKSNEKE